MPANKNLAGFSEDGGRRIERVVTAYEKGGGRTYRRHNRHNQAVGSSRKSTTTFGMVTSDIPAATQNGTAKTTTAGRQSTAGVVVMKRTTTGLEEDTNIGTLKGWNDTTPSVIRGSTAEPIVLGGHVETIDGDDYFVVDEFDLRSLEDYDKSHAQVAVHQKDSGQYKMSAGYNASNVQALMHDAAGNLQMLDLTEKQFIEDYDHANKEYDTFDAYLYNPHNVGTISIGTGDCT